MKGDTTHDVLASVDHDDNYLIDIGSFFSELNQAVHKESSLPLNPEGSISTDIDTAESKNSPIYANYSHLNRLFVQRTGRFGSLNVHHLDHSVHTPSSFQLTAPLNVSTAFIPLASHFDVQQELQTFTDLNLEDDIFYPLGMYEFFTKINLHFEDRIGQFPLNYADFLTLELTQPIGGFNFCYNCHDGEIVGFQETSSEVEQSDKTWSLTRDFGNTKAFSRGSSHNSPFRPGGLINPSPSVSTSRDTMPFYPDSDPSMPSSIIHTNSIKNTTASPLNRSLFDLSSSDISLPGLNFGICFNKEGEPIVLSSEKVYFEGKEEEINMDEPAMNQLGISYQSLFLKRQNFKERQTKKFDELKRTANEVLQANLLNDENPTKEKSEVLGQINQTYDSLTLGNEPEEFVDTSEELFLKNLKRQREASGLEWLALSRKKGEAADESEWAIPSRMANIVQDWPTLVPEPAIIYPFEMDAFQKEAAYLLEQGKSVFIAAHTSAGKTVVAEYAIALCMKHMTRAIYTSPIKALSNQKYRDFMDTFGEDIGIVTGDVSVRNMASCLIVTTEILKSMLYKGADLVRDVEWVIFDEIHYINDSERGVVWEEVIIMLPDHVNLVFLSATVPNALEFADWVGRTKKKKIYLITTDTRPVPLQHYLYFDKQLFPIADSKSYISSGYHAASHACAQFNDNNPHNALSRRNAWTSQRGGWHKIVKLLVEKQFLPAVTFIFSKKKCVELAQSLTNIDLTRKSEKSYIHRFIQNSIKRLNCTDQQLPQIILLRDLLGRGIGVHHSGLLPMMKEIVEILFANGLVKLLFATETFAMGVNMPTRTVLFHSIRKHDGNTLRNLLPSEYIQMSGRAGRRGSDTVGIVIVIIYDTPPEPTALRQMIIGKPTILQSQFRITYNMILNVLKMGSDFRIQDMIRRSFFESSNEKNHNQYRENLKRVEAKISKTKSMISSLGYDLEPIREYHNLLTEQSRIKKAMQYWLLKSCYLQEVLCIGRVVVVDLDHLPRNTLGVIIRSLGGMPYGKDTLLHHADPISRMVSILVLTNKPSKILADQYELVTTEMSSKTLLYITQRKLKKINSELAYVERDEHHITTIVQELNCIRIEYLPGLPPVMDVAKNLKIKDIEFAQLNTELDRINNVIAQNPCHDSKSTKVPLKYHMVLSCLYEYQYALKYILSENNLLMAPEYMSRLEVLKQLNYIDRDNFVLIKGRVARELNNCDELVATELIFANIFNDLDAAQIASLLSCLITESTSDITPEIPGPLISAHRKLVNLTQHLAEIQIQCGLTITPADYIKVNVNINLMHAIYDWAHNRPFHDITYMTDIPEGNIVRTIVRLDETCRDFKNACKLFGNIQLGEKMEEASNLIRRDIVFASSLYLSEEKPTAT